MKQIRESDTERYAVCGLYFEKNCFKQRDLRCILNGMEPLTFLIRERRGRKEEPYG